MKLHVFHETSYGYDQLIRRSIQMLRMTPPKTQRQHILHWQLDLPGKATAWTDAFGNPCHCLVLENPTQDIVLRARGTVELNSADQGEPEGSVPHTVFLRTTKLTSADTAIADFIEPFRATVKSRPYMGLYDVFWLAPDTLAGQRVMSAAICILRTMNKWPVTLGPKPGLATDG